jgi:hypothetical protein
MGVLRSEDPAIGPRGVSFRPERIDSVNQPVEFSHPLMHRHPPAANVPPAGAAIEYAIASSSTPLRQLR